MIKVLTWFTRKPGLSVEELRAYWRNEHPKVVLNLPGKLKGKEKELVQGARAQGFGIWPTLSEPVQVRIGILNQLSPEQISEITSRFADAMLAMGSEFHKAKVMNGLKSYYAKAA